ncbi:MAG: zinc-ribbon domain-containing protein [Candidatus Micrarchaeota archaeon]|nr:zinc-ribbon domain-containing protein [Candidatus Micrarchaeota archaeon]
MAYICAKCGKKNKLDNNVRCSYCGSRMIAKSRPNLSREISTD